jgi:predicted nucleic acid-binding protein
MKALDQQPALVLDTNVVFDWLLFNDPGCEAVGRAITSGTVRWVATASMVDEADHVLARGSLDFWRHRHEEFRRSREAWLHRVSAPEPLGPGRQLRCSDPDDQQFIDLAVSLPAAWLLTRDKALLRLRARANRAGVIVAVPGTWDLNALSRP